MFKTEDQIWAMTLVNVTARMAGRVSTVKRSQRLNVTSHVTQLVAVVKLMMIQHTAITVSRTLIVTP